LVHESDKTDEGKKQRLEQPQSGKTESHRAKLSEHGFAIIGSLGSFSGVVKDHG